GVSMGVFRGVVGTLSRAPRGLARLLEVQLSYVTALPSTVLVGGGGSIGQRHLRNLASLGIDRLVAVDPDLRRRDTLAQLGAEVHADLENGLATKPEMVVVATPPAYHAVALVAALESGAHVFVEKPLDATHEGALL